MTSPSTNQLVIFGGSTFNSGSHIILTAIAQTLQPLIAPFACNYNTSTGIYTFTLAGTYTVDFNLTLSSIGTTQTAAIVMYINGSPYRTGSVVNGAGWGNSSTAYTSTWVYTKYQAAVGDTMWFVGNLTGTANSGIQTASVLTQCTVTL